MKLSNQARIILTNNRHSDRNRRASLSVGFFQKIETHDDRKA